jgi:hypothetical protein
VRWLLRVVVALPEKGPEAKPTVPVNVSVKKSVETFDLKDIPSEVLVAIPVWLVCKMPLNWPEMETVTGAKSVLLKQPGDAGLSVALTLTSPLTLFTDRMFAYAGPEQEME